MPQASESLLSVAWTQAWQIAVVAVVVALVVKLACRRRPHLAYLLWLLVLVKAVTPPVWSSPTSAFSWALAEQVVVQPAAPHSEPARPPLAALPVTNFEPTSMQPTSMQPTPAARPAIAVEPVAPARPAITAAQLLLAAWACGAVALAVWLAASWLLLARRIRRTTSPADAALAERFERVQRRIGPRRPVRLLVSRQSGELDALGPAALGWWRGTVLVPQSVIDRSSAAELDAILAHELVHLRRVDPLVGTWQLAVQCLWWWHPAVWWANRQVRVERERSCDEAVLAQIELRPADYARLLVELLRSRRSPLPAVFWSGMRGTSSTTARVRHVLEAKTFRRRSPLAAWAIGALALAVVLPGAGLLVTHAESVENRTAASKPAVEPEASPPVAASQFALPQSQDTGVLRTVDSMLSPTAEQRAAFEVLVAQGVQLRVGGFMASGEFRPSVDASLPGSFRPHGGDDRPEALPLDVLPAITFLTVGERVGVPPTANELRAQLRALRKLLPTTQLSVYVTAENFTGLDALSQIPKLERLTIMTSGPTGTPVVPGMLPLRGLENLRFLTCWGVSDASLGDIATLTKLETLALAGELSEPALDELASLNSLKSLMLLRQSEKPSEASLRWLREMTKLEELTCQGTLRINDRAATAIRALQHLGSLYINCRGLTNDGLRQVAQAPALRNFRLGGLADEGAITSAGLSALALSKNLESIYLFGYESPSSPPLEFTDESVAGWEALQQVNQIVMQPVRMGDAALRTFGRMQALARLQLIGRLDVTDPGLAPLGSLAELEALVLVEAPRVTGVGLSALAGLGKLNLLSLAGAPIDNRGAAEIARLKTLAAIDLSHSSITSVGLEKIAALPRLERLNLANTRTGDPGFTALRRTATLQQLDAADTQVTATTLTKLFDDNTNLRVWLTPGQSSLASPKSPLHSASGPFEQIAVEEYRKAFELTTAAATDADTKAAPQGENPPRDDDEVSDQAGDQAGETVSLPAGVRLDAFAPDAAGKQTRILSFEPEFVPGDAPLPLAEIEDLEWIYINERSDLDADQIAAQIRAVRQMRPETTLMLNLKPSQGAAFDALREIPNLRRLMLPHELGRRANAGDASGRSLSLGQLPGLRFLSLAGKLDPAVLDELTPLAELEEVHLSSDQPVALPRLVGLENKPNLARLMLVNVQPGDDALAVIGQLPALEGLFLNVAGASDEGLSHLAGLGRIRWLQIDASGGGDVTPDGLKVLARLPELEQLAVYGDSLSADALLAGWRNGMPKLQHLQLDGELRDAGVIVLAALPAVEMLRLLGDVQLTEPGLDALGSMVKLKGLTLSASLTDDGLRRLAALENLELFSLPVRSELTDAGLPTVARFKKLKKLVLQDARLNGHAFGELGALDQLQTLLLRDSPIDDDGVAAIGKLTNLRELDLAGTQITDDALRSIAATLPQLTNLNVSGTQVTNAGIEQLKPLAHLQWVKAHGTQVTDDAKKLLQVNWLDGSADSSAWLEVLGIDPDR